MAHYLWLMVVILKKIWILIFLTFGFLTACHPPVTKEAEKNPPTKKIDLSKASTYNVQLGLGYLNQGDRPRAKKKLLTALGQTPHSADANAAIAYYFEKTADLDNAKKYYAKAVSLASAEDGSLGAQYNNYGAFLCRQADYKKAEEYFLKAIKQVQYIKTAGAYENAGLCSLAIPDEKKAKMYFTKALEQDPSKSQSLYELVKLESKASNFSEALKLLNKYPELVLNDSMLLAQAKEVAKNAGELKLALEYENNLAMINSGVTNEYNNHA